MASVCVLRNSDVPLGRRGSLQRHLRTQRLMAVSNLCTPHAIPRTLNINLATCGTKHCAFGSSKAAESSYTLEEATEGATTSSDVVMEISPAIATCTEYAEQPKTNEEDAEMESLTIRIKNSVLIRDVPITDSQYIHVSKGYPMDMEMNASQFLKLRAEVKDQAKKRKRELPKWYLRGRRVSLHGFRAEQLNWNSAIHIAKCRSPNLDNAMHPLFDRACFDDTPDAIYDQLKPALQLATLFLTTPICMNFWVTLAMGERTTDLEMSPRNGRLSQRIANHVVLTAERAATIIKHLDTIGRSRLIHYRFHDKLLALENTAPGGSAYAVSLPICDYKGSDSECHGTDKSVVHSIIRFHADYYIAAKKMAQLKFPDVGQKLRFSFGFAVLMMHEIAHSVEGIYFRQRDHQWLDWHTSNYYREPYWLDWNESECGRAWEQSMFGGHIQPINGRVDGAHGIATADWPFGKDDDPSSERWWSISMQYIEHMFQKATWQRKFALKDTDIFHIPRDGANSLYLNSFSTMNPSEEERVAKEELAEAMAQSNEAPPVKKRELGSGDAEEKRPDEREVLENAVVDEEEKSNKALVERQVLPMFRGTRRLSSVMPGPLPDDEVCPDISLGQD